MWATLGRMADYSVHAIGWAPRYTAYLSVAMTGPALYRDLVIWTVGAVTSRRMVVHVHRGELSGLTPHGLWAPLQRWLIRRSEFWVLGSALVAPLRAFGAVNVHVVHNGVTCASPHHGEGRLAVQTAAESGELGPGGEEAGMSVVFLGHHFRSKGVDAAAEIVEMLRDEPFSWTFAGSVVEPDTEAMLRPLEHLGSRYRRIEAVDADVRCRLLHRSDVLLLPSHNEGSPLVLIEAMEHGVVPIVSSRGCMPEMVGEVGAVCDTLDEYAEAIRLLAKDGGELAQRSAAATSRWRECYSRASFEHRVTDLLSGSAGARLE
jgi:glycosyltransferase involved in cell wall biosynthesis